jgi:hypothetical protein
MSTITNYNLSESQVVNLIGDEATSDYLWLSFAKSGTTCTLQKVIATKPTQVVFDIDLSVDAINKMVISGSYIYLALDDSSYIGRRYSTTNPLTTSTNYAVPVGLTEEPIDVAVIGSYVYFMTPGTLSGENCKIYKYGLTGTYSSTIDLTTVTNAKSMVASSDDELWITTNTSPLSLVRIYNLSTTPQFTVI